MLSISKVTKQSICIDCDPQDIDDLIWLLDALTRAAKKLKRASRAQKAIINTESPEQKEQRKAKFHAISEMAYKVYTEAIEAGNQPKEAVQSVKLTMNIGYEDAKIYIAEGKRQDRERIKKSQLKML